MNALIVYIESIPLLQLQKNTINNLHVNMEQALKHLEQKYSYSKEIAPEENYFYYKEAVNELLKSKGWEKLKWW